MDVGTSGSLKNLCINRPEVIAQRYTFAVVFCKTEIFSLMKSSVLIISMEQTDDDVFVRFRKLGYSLLGQNQVTDLLR